MSSCFFFGNLLNDKASDWISSAANCLSGTLAKPLTTFSLQAPLIHLSAKSPTLSPAARDVGRKKAENAVMSVQVLRLFLLLL